MRYAKQLHSKMFLQVKQGRIDYNTQTAVCLQAPIVDAGACFRWTVILLLSMRGTCLQHNIAKEQVMHEWVTNAAVIPVQSCCKNLWELTEQSRSNIAELDGNYIHDKVYAHGQVTMQLTAGDHVQYSRLTIQVDQNRWITDTLHWGQQHGKPSHIRSTASICTEMNAFWNFPEKFTLPLFVSLQRMQTHKYWEWYAPALAVVSTTCSPVMDIQHHPGCEVHDTPD